MTASGRMTTPVSSITSRWAASNTVSPSFCNPPGRLHSPCRGGLARRINSTRPSRTTTAPTPTRGRSGYSRGTARGRSVIENRRCYKERSVIRECRRRNDIAERGGMFEGFDRKDIQTGATTIHAVVGGSGPPLLLLHGYPQTHVMWHRITPGLAERFTVVAGDLRGYGDSGKP